RHDRGRHARGEESVRRRPPAEADQGPAFSLRLSLDVKTRLPAADQLQLTQQRGEFRLRRVPGQQARRLPNASCFGVTAARSEIAQQPRSQTLRLAHVNQFATRIDHAVDAWMARTLETHSRSKFRRTPPPNEVDDGKNPRRQEADWAKACER